MGTRMNITHLRFASLAIILPVLAGCAAAPKQPAQQSSLPAAAESKDGVITAAAMIDTDSSAPRDAQPAVPLVFQLVCYQITVPIGAVSRNEEFWKRIDEQCIDPGRYDLLRRNGMRIGEAPVSEFENIRRLLDQHPASGRSMGTIGADARNIELDMNKDVPFQTVCYYNDNNALSGRSFDKCQNIMNISYQRTPRTLGEMRLAITPMVRSLRKRLEFTAMNEEMEIKYVAPQKFYLNIIIDLPMDRFLVLAPSDSADLPTLIGHQFFVKDEPAEQMEQVLIFVAQPFRLDDVKAIR
jgi:hypothetical protein